MDIQARILDAIRNMQDGTTVHVVADSPLIGEGGLLDSMKLVELCLLLEDLGAELGFDFDWTSDTAMSRSRSMFRTPAALAAEFEAQLSAAP